MINQPTNDQASRLAGSGRRVNRDWRDYLSADRPPTALEQWEERELARDAARNAERQA